MTRRTVAAAFPLAIAVGACGGDDDPVDAAIDADAAVADRAIDADASRPDADARVDADARFDADAQADADADADPPADADADAPAAPGDTLWSVRFGDDGGEAGRAIATDGEGNVLVAGTFTGTVDFGDGPTTSAGESDVFVLSLAPDGALRWAHRLGGAGLDAAYGIATDAAGNVVVTGSFEGSVDFGDGEVMSAGAEDAFVVSLTDDGTFGWKRTFGGGGGDAAHGVATSDDGVLLAGWFESSIDFGGGALDSAGAHDIFVLGLTPTGAFRWAHRYGSTQNDSASAIATDGAGNVAVTGVYSGSVDFGTGALSTPSGNANAFLLRTTPDGTTSWARRWGAAAYSQGLGVATDSDGSVITTGGFAGMVDFGGGTLTGRDHGSIFVVKLDVDGAFAWARDYHSSLFMVSGTAAAVGPSDDVFIAGRLRDSVVFGPLVLGSGGEGSFVLALDSLGTERWARGFGPSVSPGGIAVVPTGDVRFTGGFQSRVTFGAGELFSAGGSDAVVLALHDE